MEDFPRGSEETLREEKGAQQAKKFVEKKGDREEGREWKLGLVYKIKKKDSCFKFKKGKEKKRKEGGRIEF